MAASFGETEEKRRVDIATTRRRLDTVGPFVSDLSNIGKDTSAISRDGQSVQRDLSGQDARVRIVRRDFPAILYFDHRDLPDDDDDDNNNDDGSRARNEHVDQVLRRRLRVRRKSRMRPRGTEQVQLYHARPLANDIVPTSSPTDRYSTRAWLELQ